MGGTDAVKYFFFFSAVIKREKSFSGNVLEFKDTAANKQAERAQ